MVSRDFVFWEVDVQRDFVLPGGKLYVPGAEKLLPNIRRLTDAARQGRVFLVSHGDFHAPDDPEFKIFPPHCVKGTSGSELVPEAITEIVARVPNEPEARLPDDLTRYQQILLEKQTLSIFESRHADELVKKLGTQAEFVVFGVVTEYCVSFAVKGPARTRSPRRSGHGCSRDSTERRRRKGHCGIRPPGGKADNHRSCSRRTGWLRV